MKREVESLHKLEKLQERNENEFEKLSSQLFKKLNKVSKSVDGKIVNHLASVKLKNDRIIECVNFMEAKTYLKYWGDINRLLISPSEIIDIYKSPFQLPSWIANKIYKHGETGMGCYIFSLVMKNGKHLSCSTGNLVDFIKLPLGYKYTDIINVSWEVKDRNNVNVQGLDYYWCIYR